MRLSSQSPGVRRTAFAITVRGGDAAQITGLVPSSKKLVTGKAVCKRNGNVLFTASEEICVKPDHAGCTAAKNEAAAANLAVCGAEGGLMSHSGAPCTYGKKC